jgi:hypothetical protein
LARRRAADRAAGVSIGLAANVGGRCGDDGLLRDADAAMNAAKSRGKNTHATHVIASRSRNRRPKIVPTVEIASEPINPCPGAEDVGTPSRADGVASSTVCGTVATTNGQGRDGGHGDRGRSRCW